MQWHGHADGRARGRGQDDHGDQGGRLRCAGRTGTAAAAEPPAAAATASAAAGQQGDKEKPLQEPLHGATTTPAAGEPEPVEKGELGAAVSVFDTGSITRTLMVLAVSFAV